MNYLIWYCPNAATGHSRVFIHNCVGFGMIREGSERAQRDWLIRKSRSRWVLLCGCTWQGDVGGLMLNRDGCAPSLAEVIGLF